MSFFTANALCAAYGRRQVLSGASFCVEKKEIVGILGANGSGKTTLLKSICGILPHTGECILSGERLESLSPRQLARICSYIPQRSGIAIDLSVQDVVLMGFNARLALLEQPSAQMRADALRALRHVGLEARAQENYLNLSEGQKQLCIFARALAAQSHMLLLDEPESALDFHHRNHMLYLIRRWVDAGERCALVSLHDPQLALRHCDQLLLIDQGKIIAALHPQSDTLERMEGALRRLYGKVELARCIGRNGESQLVLLDLGGEYK